jgi:TolB protein
LVVALALVVTAACSDDAASTTQAGSVPSVSEATSPPTEAPATTPTTPAPPTSPATTTSATTTTLAPAPVTLDPYLPSALGRTEIPWGEVGAGWYVVLYDAEKSDFADSSELRHGPAVLYLVDAAGTRYEIAAWTGDDRPWLLADARGTAALVGRNGPGGSDMVYERVDLTTGASTPVHTVGFPESSYSSGRAVSLTQPTGANVVVYRSDGTDEWLERRSPDGALLATVYTQPYTDAANSLRWMYGYDGTSLLVTHVGGIAAVSNDGTLLQELWVPADHRCDPVRWWDSDTFLATCYGRGPGSAPLDEFGNPHTFYGRLWLLEADGSAGVAMTEYPAAAPPVVDFGYHDAWPGGPETFIQWRGDCGAAAVAVLQPSGTGTFLSVSVPPSIVPDGIGMVDIVSGQMAVEGWQGCAHDVGVLFATNLNGVFRHDMVPVVGDARGVVGTVGLASVYP